MTATSITRQALGLRLERTFAAPRDRVFRALSSAEELMNWWGPPAYPVVYCDVDFRPGGVWHYCLRNAAGHEVWARSTYSEIVAPERISYLERSSDAAGSLTDERPAAFATLALEPAGNGTRFTATLRYQDELQRDRALRYGVERGFAAALDLLERHLASDAITEGRQP